MCVWNNKINYSKTSSIVIKMVERHWIHVPRKCCTGDYMILWVHVCVCVDANFFLIHNTFLILNNNGFGMRFYLFFSFSLSRLCTNNSWTHMTSSMLLNIEPKSLIYLSVRTAYKHSYAAHTQYMYDVWHVNSQPPFSSQRAHKMYSRCTLFFMSLKILFTLNVKQQ